MCPCCRAPQQGWDVHTGRAGQRVELRPHLMFDAGLQPLSIRERLLFADERLHQRGPKALLLSLLYFGVEHGELLRKSRYLNVASF